MQNIRLPKLSVSLNIKFCVVAVVANVFFRFYKKNRGAVAQVRRKVPIGYNGAPQIRPQKYPFPWTDRQTPSSALSLDPSDLRCQTASGSDTPFFHNALDR